MEVASCKLTVGTKRVENDVKAIQKRVPFTSKCSQKRWRLGLHPRPPNSEGERFRPLPCLTRRVENGVKAIQKWVPFTPKCSQKRWRLGLHPRPPIARESGGTPPGLASLIWKIENGVDAIQKWASFTPNCSQVPKARESAFGLASLTLRREERQFPSPPRAPETLGTPLGLMLYRRFCWAPRLQNCILPIYLQSI